MVLNPKIKITVFVAKLTFLRLFTFPDNKEKENLKSGRWRKLPGDLGLR